MTERPVQSGRRIDYVCFQPTREGQASHAHVYEIVAGLRRRGWDVQVIEPPYPRPGRGDGLRRAFAAAAIQIRYWIRRRLRPAPFVYIRTHFLSLPTALFAKIAGSVVIQEINGPLGDSYDAWPRLRPIHRLLSWVVLSQLRWANAVVTVTPGLADYYAARTGHRERYHVIGNGADVDLFVPTVVTEARRYVVFVGALASWQGIDTALHAVLDPVWPEGIDLVIAGDGRERSRVESATQADPRVRWLGTVPYARAATLVSESLAALVPMNDVARSRYGLSPLKLFEAMACGVPVIASSLPGIREVVEAHECGLLFRADDAAGLANAVARLAANPALAGQMGAAGRKAAEQHYSWDARAGQTQAVLEAVATDSTT